MGNLDQLTFSEPEQKEFELDGHKWVLREASSGDQLSMNADFDKQREEMKTVDEEGNEVVDEAKANANLKILLNNIIELLSYTIVSIDGIVPENPEATKAFLLKKKSKLAFDLFGLQNELAKDLKEVNEEVKN